MDNNKQSIPALYVLGAEPLEKVGAENFFSETDNPLFKLLKDPPYLRYSGWNLLTLDYPHIKDGNSWIVKNGERKTIRLYKDGTLIAIAYADNSFLGWGQDYDKFIKFPKLNTLAVIEYTYEFIELYRNIIQNFNSTDKIRFKIGIKNIDLSDGKKLILKPEKVGTLFPDFNEGNNVLSKDFYDDLIINLKDNSFLSEYVSFQLLSLVFIHFGISPDKIPYTKQGNDNKRFIDFDEIRNIR